MPFEQTINKTSGVYGSNYGSLKTRIAITIVTDQHRDNNCKEDIMMLAIIINHKSNPAQECGYVATVGVG